MAAVADVTQSCYPSQQGAPVPPAVGVDWASFDRCVVLGDVAPSSTAVSRTTNGREVRVALRIVAPPAMSYVHLYTEDCAYGGEPTVVAADGDLLLIHMLVNVEGMPSWRCPGNLFVCKVDPGRPWLEGLPSIGNWIGRGRHTGIARCGGKDFFVADLQPRAANLSAGCERWELFRYSSATKLWELKRLDMPHDPELGINPLCWEADTVFSFDGFMCWADYHQGILFCDVSADHPELRFIRFPGIEMWHDFRDGRGPTERYRTASVSNGRLWFIDVDDGRFRSVGSSVACTITTWTLKTPDFEWVPEHTLQLSELWSDWKYQQSPLPRSVPGFPIIDMQQADVLHFVVQGCWDSTEHWMITVDIRKMCLMSYEMCQNAIDEPESEFDVSNLFCDDSLICCELST